MSEPTIRPASERAAFDTGSVRGSRTGKGRFDLLPPEVEHELALHFEQGAEVYGDRNWQKGQPLGRYVDSLKRHLNQWQRGMRDEPHLRAVAWNAMALLWTVGRILEGKLPFSLDDAGYLNPDIHGPEYEALVTKPPQTEGVKYDPLEPPVTNTQGYPRLRPEEVEAAGHPRPTAVEAVADYLSEGPVELDELYDELASRGHVLVDIYAARKQLKTVAYEIPESNKTWVAFEWDMPSGATPVPRPVVIPGVGGDR